MNKTITLEEIFPLIKEQLESGGRAAFISHGTSMKPLLKDGENKITLIKPLEEPRKYDIIFYRRSDGKFILHRIVGVKKDGFVCRGDNQFQNEFPVTKEQIIAVLSEYTKNGKQKKINCFSQKLYARFWVNTMWIRRCIYNIIKRK